MTKNAMFNLRDYTTADILNTPVRRGGILPVTEYPNRTEFDLSSGLTGALMDAFTAPARAARGEITEDQQIPEAFNFAGSLTLGGLLAPRPTGSVGMGGRPTKKQFKEYLNKKFPFNPSENNRRGSSGNYGQRGADYGDYLWRNDRGQFDFEYAEWLKKQGNDGGSELSANAKTGAAVPLATKVLEAQQPQGIRAFHGSPHDFDRFSMDAIGTGEGAQAYGHGLYFAENEGVAKAYREALSDKTDALTPVTFEGRKIGPSAPGISGEDLAARFAAQSGGNAKLARAHIRGMYNDPNNLPPAHKEAMRLLTEQPERFASAKYLEPGHMYEVNIKADQQDFLDWDKPLSEQSEKVRNAVLGSGLAKTPFGSIDTVKRLLARERGLLQEAEQELSANRGMFGRSKLSTDQRDYYARQIEDSKARIDEFERILSGDATASYLVPQGGDTAAQFSSAMRDAGIPGIRYLDQMSRGTGEGSSNYVVFDDALVEILRKYGLLPPVAAGGLAAALGQEDELY